MAQGSWRGSCGVARGSGLRWVGPWEGVGGSWHCTWQSGGQFPLERRVLGDTGSLLGPFVIPQPLLRCLCWRRTCGSVVSLGAVPQFPRLRREAGRARCLPVAALVTAWQCSWEIIAVHGALHPLPEPPASPACPFSLPQAGGFIAPGGVFNPFSVSCKAGMLQRAWLPADGCPLPLWVQHPHSLSCGWLLRGDGW